VLCFGLDVSVNAAGKPESAQLTYALNNKEWSDPAVDRDLLDTIAKRQFRWLQVCVRKRACG
jgi:hypothetical protein